MRGLALALCATAALLCGCGADRSAGYQGYIEGEYVQVAAAAGGRLERLLVQRGQQVAAQAPLFHLEAEEESAARQQAEDQLRAAQAQLADLRVGKRPPEQEVLAAQLAQAQASEQQAQQQLRRDEAQLRAGGIPRAQVDDSRAQLAVQAARVRELAGQLQVARLPARIEQVRAQDAQVAAARAAVRQAEWRLGQKQLAASQAALVSDTLYRVGEWVPAGSPVVRLLPPQNIKARFFVPETVAGGLQTGRKVLLHCDGCAADVPATVNFIASEPEFTPPVIYSNEARAKLVFLVEAKPAPEQAQKLHPGQPVTVTLQ